MPPTLVILWSIRRGKAGLWWNCMNLMAPPNNPIKRKRRASSQVGNTLLFKKSERYVLFIRISNAESTWRNTSILNRSNYIWNAGRLDFKSHPFYAILLNIRLIHGRMMIAALCGCVRCVLALLVVRRSRSALFISAVDVCHPISCEGIYMGEFLREGYMNFLHDTASRDSANIALISISHCLSLSLVTVCTIARYSGSESTAAIQNHFRSGSGSRWIFSISYLLCSSSSMLSVIFILFRSFHCQKEKSGNHMEPAHFWVGWKPGHFRTGWHPTHSVSLADFLT